MSDRRSEDVIVAVSAVIVALAAVVAIAWLLAFQSLPSKNAEGGEPSYAAQQCERARQVGPSDLPLQVGAEPETQAKSQQSSKGEGEPTLTDWCDLASQESMAISAANAANAAWAGSIATIAATALLAVTLWFTGKAAAYARRAAEATEDTAKITRKVGEAQVRAYLAIDQLGFTVTGHTRRLEPFVAYRNTGNSPARNVIIAVRFAPYPADHRPDRPEHTDLFFQDDLPSRGEGAPINPITGGAHIAPDLWNREGQAPVLAFVAMDVLIVAKDVFDKDICVYACGAVDGEHVRMEVRHEVDSRGNVHNPLDQEAMAALREKIRASRPGEQESC